MKQWSVLGVIVAVGACGGGGGGGGGEDPDAAGGDGVIDAAGAIDATPAWAIDSDGDGASDVVEDALGTDPDDEEDSPEANGDVAVLVPYQAAPADQLVVLSGVLTTVDVYVIVDRSGSMTGEMTAIKDNMGAVIDGLQCMPAGSGTPPDCVPDLYAGVGTLGYQNKEPFTNRLDLQTNPNFAGVTFTTVDDTNTKEASTFATWAAVTGLGSASATGCTLATVAARTTCPAGTWGYPCFRDGAFPIVALATDEQPITDGGDTYECPAWPAVVAPAFTSRGARVVGIKGSGAAVAVGTDLALMATDTGAVDAKNGNEPLVVDGSDTTAATAIGNALQTLVAGVPLDVGLTLRDDDGDAVDVADAFLDGFEVAPTARAACDDTFTTQGARYLDAPPGTTLCWTLVAKENATVEPTAEAQVFHATVDEVADGITVLTSRDVYFVVPPAP